MFFAQHENIPDKGDMDDDSMRYTDQQRDKSRDLSSGSPASRQRRETRGEESKGTPCRWIRREAAPLAARVLVQLLLWWITRDPHHFDTFPWGTLEECADMELAARPNATS
jgi:hypothetical protein